MAFYIISGLPDCIQFAHACYVAQYLHDHLPNFKYKKNSIAKSKWPDYVLGLNKKNRWHLVNSPIIWKEISDWGGKPYLIGGMGQFWEYCYCYYGLATSIAKEDLEKLARDNLKYFKAEEDAQMHRKFDTEICIFGALHPLVPLLIGELGNITQLRENNGLHLKLYETGLSENLDVKYLEKLIENYEACGITDKSYEIEIAGDEEEAIIYTDLLIYLENVTKLDWESQEIYLNRCRDRMEDLAYTINIKGKRSLRIIFCNDDPVCFLATLLVEYCTSMSPANIVALTADRGLPVIRAVSEMTGVPVSKIGAPPVWGFVGFNEYIDDENILFKANVYRPYARALTSPEGSTLPQGIVYQELRLMSYLLPDMHNTIIETVKERNKNVEKNLPHQPCFVKLTSLMSFLKIWYSKEITDEIVSLGICSNGSYEITPGIVFSQPAIQDKKRRWIPFQNFSLMNSDTVIEIKQLLKGATDILEKIDYVSHVGECESQGTVD
ncbi:putative malate dehydrogenase 1B [Sitophilus oryzae]|uniref:Malate dehydrogenase 1B n=1 Tax=Sitophilus oryzae TaxID=7048 RepID=A0A6J2XSQ6_SITOR|nr:putative malate dehydrogenase 1B [Sitophilus oryzae]